MGVETHQIKLITEQIAEEANFSGSTKKHTEGIYLSTVSITETPPIPGRKKYPKAFFDFSRGPSLLGYW